VTEPAIRVDALVKRYAGRTILDGVSLHVAPGEIVALLGPNGAGKTTTVEIVEGYRRPDSGTVRVLGMDPATGGPALRARVGLMLQGGGLDPRSTPVDVLRLYAAFHVGARDPGELLATVGLERVARTRVRRLSGGERQRLALALALVGDPEVLLLDEPTSGMDPEARRDTREHIAELRSDGRAILLTTHDLGDVERLADRVAILHAGRIVAAGTVAELTAASAPRLRFRLATAAGPAAILALGEVLQAGGAGTAARVVSDPERGTGSFAIDGISPDPRLIESVAVWAAAQDLTIVELRAAGGTLEERYLELTGSHGVEAVA
jgi:ABC-2 type transport system ATP-binding protein